MVREGKVGLGAGLTCIKTRGFETGQQWLRKIYAHLRDRRPVAEEYAGTSAWESSRWLCWLLMGGLQRLWLTAFGQDSANQIAKLSTPNELLI